MDPLYSDSIYYQIYDVIKKYFAIKYMYTLLEEQNLPVVMKVIIKRIACMSRMKEV